MAGGSNQSGKTTLMLALMAYAQTYLPTQRLGRLHPVSYADPGLVNSRPGSDQPCYTAAPLVQWPLPGVLEPGDRPHPPLPLDQLWLTLQQHCQQHDWVLMDMVGSLGTPIADETTVADLAWDWRLPTVLVISVSPEAIAQAVTNVALARQAKVPLRGIILNCKTAEAQQFQDQLAPIKQLQSLTRVPILGTLPHLADPQDVTALAQAASKLDLERFIPIFRSAAFAS